MGALSAELVELLIFFQSPFSLGTVKISPLLSKTARLPEGDNCGLIKLAPVKLILE